jgi:succinate-semialdehyde dehydrogenase/glutarate-semialdehyde dehydrogenase
MGLQTTRSQIAAETQEAVMAYATLNPATGDLVQEFAEISDGDLLEAVTIADTCYRSHWSRRSIQARAQVVAGAAAHMMANIEEYASLSTLEMGKPITQSHGEVQLSAAILEYYARNAEAFLEPRRIVEAQDGIVSLLPIGIILAVEPWNFPYYQAARVIGPQLMVGNVVMMKHASNVPQCALALARAVKAGGAPDGAYTNIFASIPQTMTLIDDPRIRGVTVTGSERAGAAVAERAGRALKKSVMELGGSDPFIVLEDAPLDVALDNALLGRIYNAGQSCVSSKRFIIVGQERGDSFLKGFIARMGAISPGDPLDPKTLLGPVSSEKALNGLLRQISEAQTAGARVVLGGRQVDRPGYYLEPTIITDIDPKNPLFLQETFGPVASVYVVDTEDEAISLANATPFGLGSSVFSGDIDRARRVAERIDSGMVFINQPTSSAPELPFGGVKNSGYGRELSELGFGEFINHRLINAFPAGSVPALTAA